MILPGGTYNTLNLIYLLYLLNLFYLLLICCDRLAGPEDNMAFGIGIVFSTR